MNNINFEDFKKYLEKQDITISTVDLSKFKQDLERRNNIDTVNTENRNPYLLFGYLNDRLLQHLKDGTSFLLPKNGLIKTPAAYDLTTGKIFTGLSQIMLQERMEELGTKVPAFFTYKDLYQYSIQSKNREQVIFPKGTYPIKIPNVNEYKWDIVLDVNKWFNFTQIKAKAGFAHRYTSYYGVTTYYNYSTTIDDVIYLNPKTKTPFKYVAQVLNAIYTNKGIRINDEQAENFRKNTIKLLSNILPNNKRDILATQKLCISAQRYYEEHFSNIKKKDKDELYRYSR